MAIAVLVYLPGLLLSAKARGFPESGGDIENFRGSGLAFIYASQENDTQRSGSGVKAEIQWGQPEGETNGGASLAPEAYARLALASVRKSYISQGENTEEFRFELFGDPVVRPDRSELRTDALSRDQRLEAAVPMPEAFVHINVYRENAFKERATVTFMNRKPDVRFSGRKSPGDVFSKGIMDEAEFKDVVEKLDPFFSVAVDVSRDSERFHSFFPYNIRSLLKHPDRKFRLNMPPAAVDPSWRERLLKEAGPRNTGPGSLGGMDNWKKRLSDKDLRRFVALTLDLAVQQNWLAFEGLEPDPDTRLQIQLLVSNPKEYIKLLEKTVSQNRRLLEKAGVLAPSHFRLTCGYIKQLIGQSIIVKEVPKPEPCPCFLLPFLGEKYVSSRASELEVMNNVPEDASLYLFGMAGMRLHFSNVDAIPRIVCIALD